MRGIVARFEERAADGEAVRQSWEAAREAMRAADDQVRTVRLAVLANALTLVHFDTDQDVVDLSRITEEITRDELADLQDELLAPVDTGRARPITTSLVRTLGARAWGQDSRTPGCLTHDEDLLRELCGETALRLLMVDHDGAGDLPQLTSADDVLEVFRSGDLLVWRRLARAALTDPWSGRNDTPLALLDPDRQPCEFGGVKALVELTRRRAEEDERRAVADHIRRTITSTGLTQREFASLVGTSPSRLSTYVTGSVTPSAAMMLRINRTAKRALRAPRPPRPNDSA
ncbi:hypothetical protein ASE01_03990 [Nocardioides sp. Root190]|uniref:helix-turn-helix domain-containing protein n=1 Tax=Nocardioides sp. Root190 TaxID=1736488 RepID=UPI0006FBE639|nr:helix-turn-helix transcriptional regulator [Nocardioides sp. Root190]KRB78436.1 hypothetical protein ASE01_03990 [Nocardioides sp. Root190]